jgi:hypothetical protein
MIRVRLWFAAAALVIAVTGLATPMAARADVPSGSFTTLARADAFRVSVSATGFVVSELTDTSGPEAQSKLDGLGTSTGFASLLYPGDTVATTPGLGVSQVFGALKQPPPTVPSYPLTVSSQSSGQPDANLSQGPVTLAAHSSNQSSTGHAAAAGVDSGGNSLGKAVSDSSVKVGDTGKLTSDASSDVESITIGGILRIGAMVATAHSETSPDGKPATTSSFRTEGVTIAGTPVGISDKGLVLAGSTQPLPDTSSLAQALSAAGITVQPIKPVTQDGAVSSGGVSITAIEPLPTGNTATVTYSLGVVHAETSGQASPASGTDTGSASPAGTDTGSGGSGAPAGGPEGSAGGAAAVPAGDQGGGASLAIPGSSGSPAALSAGGSSPGAAARAPSSATANNSAALGGLPVSTTSSLSVYLVLVVGAAVAASAAFLFRTFAVRLAWIT